MEQVRIGVIGLGYVGLPLAVEFARRGVATIGYDVNPRRIERLMQGEDATGEVDRQRLESSGLRVTDEEAALADCNVYIVTVPTPVDAHKQPDLRPLVNASKAVARHIAKGDVVIYESTVYPGATEEVCVPVIERYSKGLKFNRDFFAGYSPERINPGDNVHKLNTVIKITSGSTPEAAEFVARLYEKVVDAGVHRASSIRVAEAAKVIENTQRDVNIALINELAMIFGRMGIDTQEVLAAAGTKWNFLPFRPGLVGGHCISVDPYYLTHKAKALGYSPQVILAGRRINDGMGRYIARRVAKLMAFKHIHVVESRILILGVTFKENCPDVRNTRVVDIVSEFQEYYAQVDICDPWADADDLKRNYDLSIVDSPEQGVYDAVILAVAHREFVEMGSAAIRAFGKPQSVVFDVKSVLDRDSVDGRL